MNPYYIQFTKEMKKDYTLLVPTMLPMHFKMLISVLETYGYKADLLTESGPEIVETGLKYVHNDTCYPALLVIGQFIHALQSGKYDPHKTALLYFQTGGGCRASNYVSLLRKALKKAGLEYVPVVAMSFSSIENHPGLKLDAPKIHGMMYAVLYGDLLMSLVNQVRPYENHKGEAQALADRWCGMLAKEIGKGRRKSYKKIKQNYRQILADFAAVEVTPRPAVKVGVVGEIFVKFSPLGNNNLEQFLVNEGAETVVPGLVDFLLYCFYNAMEDRRLYGRGVIFGMVSGVAYRLICKKKNDLIAIMKEDGRFTPPAPFEQTVKMAEGYIGHGTKMGEGWLLTAEMLELSHSGVKNIVCTQPFGCLPNHICGKGMMKPIKEKNPDVNIVAIDYDPGATKVNQENRLKLMLANAKPVQSEDALTAECERKEGEYACNC